MKDLADYKIGDKVQILFGGLLKGQFAVVCDRYIGYDNKTIIEVQMDDGSRDAYELPTSLKPANSEIIRQRLGIK